ncbi:MAG: FAD-dependent monooxygenase, partial [Solirubrobacteraceae bacterium]
MGGGSGLQVIVVGAGIGGLSIALTCHRRGIACRVFEQSAVVGELGVGINMLPHAVRELRDLGLLGHLDAVGVRTYELFYLNRFGQEVWHELRGLDAGHEVPQLSIHRGHLQGVLLRAVQERLGSDAVRTGHRLVEVAQDGRRVIARFQDRSGAEVARVGGDVLVGADGI